MRTLNSIKNLITGFIPFVILILLGFWKIKVWQTYFDSDIYAINQLFFQIFAYLSIAEAGIGALVYKEYYRFFAQDDKDNICIYYTLSRRMLQKVTMIIAGIGILASFILPSLAKNNSLSPMYIRELFFLFLAKNLVDYLMFCPRFVLQADQKLYKINFQLNGYRILEAILEIALVSGGSSFELVLIVTMLLRIFSNFRLNRIVFKEYSWLQKVSDTKHYKITGMHHVMVTKLVDVVYENIDIIIISAYVSPLAVVIYSNYKYLTKYLYDVVYMIGTSITSSLGNVLHVDEDKEKMRKYQMINTLFSFIGVFLTITLYFSIDSFMVVWVGKEKLFQPAALACIMFLFYHSIVRKPIYLLRDIFALYKDVQVIVILESILNAVLSIILVQKYQITGVLIATVIATLLTNFWYFPFKIYKKVFDRGAKEDFFKYIAGAVISITFIFFTKTFLFSASQSGYLMWFLSSTIYALFVGIILGLIYFVMYPSFRDLIGKLFIPILKKISHRRSL